MSPCVNCVCVCVCVCDEGTSGLLHAGGHFAEPRQFFFLYSATELFFHCIHVELAAALGRLHTSVFSKFAVLEFEMMKTDCVFYSEAVVLNN